MRQVQRYSYFFLCTALTILLGALKAHAQIKDYVIFGNTGVQIGTSSNILSGKVGSNLLITSVGNATFGGDLVSKGKIVLANSNSVSGNISAANATNPAATGTIFQT